MRHRQLLPDRSEQAFCEKLVQALSYLILPPAVLVILALGLASAVAAFARTETASVKGEPGLAVSFTSLGGGATARSGRAAAPNVSLFVAAGKSPSPFLPPGPFMAVWEGTLEAELRGDFLFQAELNGQLRLEINGLFAVEVEGRGGLTPLSAPVRLRKGLNAFKAAFTSPHNGDAFLRLRATEHGTNTTPIPASLLWHHTSAEIRGSAELLWGRELFLEHRCARCHTPPNTDNGIPELKMDAPSFEGIGARLTYSWMARWILDPVSVRSSAIMPKLLRGPGAKKDAEAIAAFLASLKQGEDLSNLGKTGLSETNRARESGKLQTAAGQETRAPGLKEPQNRGLFEKLRCAACHDAEQGERLSLKGLAEKFAPGKLAEFLQQPEAHFAWTRMPNFHLTASEAGELADSLLTSAQETAKGSPAPADRTAIQQGRALVQSSGCLNCHQLHLENRFAAPKLAELRAANWTNGCVSPTDTASTAPRFNFSSDQLRALQMFEATDRLSLERHVPAEFAERQIRLLNCRGCHGVVELVPPVEILGGKLKPEWTAKFLAGGLEYKPRPEKHPRGELWMEARMPAFKSWAPWLAEGLAAEHGWPPHTGPDASINLELAAVGRKLASKEGGFSCVSCHAVGSVEASEVVESEGINFVHVAERLLPDYFRRWVRNPLSIDPATKMPVYFDEGRSPLPEVLDGDAERQIEALWQYIRLQAQ